MAKKLITVNNLNQYVVPEKQQLILSSDMILTSGAKDYLRQKGYAICVQKPSPTDSLEHQLRQLLSQTYEITDTKAQDQLIQAITLKINQRMENKP